MSIATKLKEKFGPCRSRKHGEELIFTCPKCGHEKFEINVRTLLYHCFHCKYGGKMDEIPLDHEVHYELPEEEKMSLNPMPVLKLPSRPWLAQMHVINKDNPGHQKYIKYLKSRGVSRDPADFMVSKDPALRNRVIIPVLEDGEMVSYVARSINGQIPKELKPEDAADCIYFSRPLANANSLVVVEGVFDCEKIFAAVSILGSNPTDVQVGKILKLGATRIGLGLDNDEAGKRGNEILKAKLIKRGYKPDQIVSISWKPYKDPGEIPYPKLKAILRRYI